MSNEAWAAAHRAMSERIVDLERKLDEANEESDALVLTKRTLTETVGELETALAQAREALQFYADEWLRTAEEGTPYEPTDALWDDKGDRARRALTGHTDTGGADGADQNIDEWMAETS